MPTPKIVWLGWDWFFDKQASRRGFAHPPNLLSGSAGQSLGLTLPDGELPQGWIGEVGLGEGEQGRQGEAWCGPVKPGEAGWSSEAREARWPSWSMVEARLVWRSEAMASEVMLARIGGVQ